jgi:hypothetical protein
MLCYVWELLSGFGFGSQANLKRAKLHVELPGDHVPRHSEENAMSPGSNWLSMVSCSLLKLDYL